MALTHFQKIPGDIILKSTISEHLSNIYETNELSKEAIVRNFRTVQSEGAREVTQLIEYYNLKLYLHNRS